MIHVRFCIIFQPFTVSEMIVLSVGKRDSALYLFPNVFIIEYWSIICLW